MRWPAFDPKEWHRWFAWHPVEVDGMQVWWERIERRWDVEAGCSADFSGYSFPTGAWIYRQMQGTA
jgi:hypothetical protein